VLCLIGQPKAHNFWHGPSLARPNLIVGLGQHDPICEPCLGLKFKPMGRPGTAHLTKVHRGPLNIDSVFN
jgi:hypothetical protein